ncbi:unnamed protein product [Nyctereutes procyonoides]|uniref:nucleoside-diphosphate kinase n=1 Tax=Nyctereutes procyonoides TaxID=34880 RepID=A0A811Z706_NYCPR|nr:unnamed protein product [Nyctereutes procyonoides]
MLQTPDRVLAEHYHDLQTKPLYPALISYRTSGPVVAMVWEGPNVVCSLRTVIGHTDSAETAPAPSGGSADSVEGAPRDSQLWFQSSELVHGADENHQSSIYAA